MFAVGSSFDPQLRRDGVFDTAVLTIRYKDGSQSCHSARRASAFGYDQRVELITNGELIAAENVFDSSAVHCSSSGISSLGKMSFSFPDRYAVAYRREIDHFASMAHHFDVQPLVSCEHNILVALVCDAALKSAQTNQSQRIVF